MSKKQLIAKKLKELMEEEGIEKPYQDNCDLNAYLIEATELVTGNQFEHDGSDERNEYFNDVFEIFNNIVE